MKQIALFTVFIFLSAGLYAQSWTPAQYTQAKGIIGDSVMRAPRMDGPRWKGGAKDSIGAIIYDNITKSLWNKTDTGWTKVGAGTTPAQVDTVPLVDSLEEYTGPAKILFVTDPYRGGFFVKKSNGSNNGITQFFSHDGDYWYRVYNPEDGILVDWAGADPTGVGNSAPAFQSAFAFSNHISLRANATYLITDSLAILNKNNFILDGKGATIKESSSFYTTLLVKRCYDVVIKDLHFDGPEDYAYFLTSDPASAKQHIYIDSSDYITMNRLYSQRKRGMITMSNCSHYNIYDLYQEGIFKNGVASNVLSTFGIRTIGYGFNEPITYYTGFGNIDKFTARNTGAPILLGDNTTYLSITNCTFDSTYNNGIYVSSALWCSITGNILRNIGGSGIKARGFGFTITSNIVTKADLGIVVTGNSAEDFYGQIPTKYNTNGYSETISNNVIDTVSTRGIDVDFQDGLATHNTTIANNTFRINNSLTDYMLKVNTAGGTIITGNRFQGSKATIAAYFQRATGDSTQTNIIANNIFRDCAGQALHIQGLKRSLVTGNNFDSLGAAALVFDNSNQNTISNNIYVAGTVVHATSANGNTGNFITNNRGAITADNATSVLLNNFPNPQQNISNTPLMLGQTAVSGTNVYVSVNTTAPTGWQQLTPAARTISTTAPLSGGGALTGNLTLAISDASASSSGVVNTTTQTFAGNKTFNNNLTVAGTSQFGPTTSRLTLSSTSFNYSVSSALRLYADAAGVGIQASDASNNNTDSRSPIENNESITILGDGRSATFRRNANNMLLQTYSGSSDDVLSNITMQGRYWRYNILYQTAQAGINQREADFQFRLNPESSATLFQIKYKPRGISSFIDSLFTVDTSGNALVLGRLIASGVRFTSGAPTYGKVLTAINTDGDGIYQWMTYTGRQISTVSDEVLTTDDNVVYVSNLAPITVTLPGPFTMDSRILVIKKNGGPGNNISISGVDSATLTITKMNSSIVLHSYNGVWHLVAGHSPDTVY